MYFLFFKQSGHYDRSDLQMCKVNKKTLFQNSVRNTIRESNSLGPDQAQYLICSA